MSKFVATKVVDLFCAPTARKFMTIEEILHALSWGTDESQQLEAFLKDSYEFTRNGEKFGLSLDALGSDLSINFVVKPFNSLQNCEENIKNGLNAMSRALVVIGGSLFAIKANSYHKQQKKYSTFEKYCQGTFGFTDNYVNKLIKSYVLLQAMREHLDHASESRLLQSTESHLRVLSGLDPEEAANIYNKVCEDKVNKKITANDIEKKKKEVLGIETPNTTEGQLETPNTTEGQLETPNTTEGQPETPNTTEGQPETPNTTEQPETPNTTEQPETPNTTKQPETPNTTEQPETPNTTEQPETPNTTKDKSKIAKELKEKQLESLLQEVNNIVKKFPTAKVSLLPGDKPGIMITLN